MHQRVGFLNWICEINLDLHEEFCLSLCNEKLFPCPVRMEDVAIGLKHRASVSETWDITQDLKICNHGTDGKNRKTRTIDFYPIKLIRVGFVKDLSWRLFNLNQVKPDVLVEILKSKSKT